MRRTAILRFSDAEAGTLGAHREIITAHRETWWGWWKKRSEPFRERFLDYLRRATRQEPLRIGLVNRKGDEEFAVAVCNDVAFASGGEPIASPDPGLTPEYYRTGTFPAWFKITQIHSINRAAFVREFGDVPSLDPTLYEVFEEKGRVEMNPRANWTMEPIPTVGDTILHLSDLHFGDDYGFPLERIVGTGVDRQLLPDLLAERISQLGLSIGIVVISGDLITRGDANHYPTAEEFLSKLLQMLDLEREHCVIVPGNHDLWTAGVEHPTREYAHEAPYKQFVSAFFRTEFQGLERVRRYRTRAGEDLVFVELNSSRIRSDALKEYGYVSKHRYEALLEWINEVLKENPAPSGRRTMFAVLHHHVLPVWAVSIPDDQRPVSLCLDAGELIDQFQKHGIRFVLHGHQHSPFVGLVSRGPMGIDVAWNREQESVFTFGCGSSGARADRLPRDLDRGVVGNIYGLYTVARNAVQVNFEQYTDLTPPTRLWRITVPMSE